MKLNYDNASLIDFVKKLPKSFSFNQSDEKIITMGEDFGECEFNFSKEIEVKLTIIFLPTTKLYKKTFNLKFNLEEYTKLDLKVANLSNCNVDDNITISLNSPNATVDFYAASILNKKLEKKSQLVVKHLARQTRSNMKAYEVLKGESKGFVRCISDIREKSSGSEAHQELRLLVLDEKARADSDPVLLIDENDIVASHANAIGILDPEQLFYLKSRGLNDIQAQELIINGYFEPIFINLANLDLEKELKVILKGMI